MSLLNASFPEAHHHFNELPLPPPMHPSYLPPPPRPPHPIGPPPPQREPSRDYPRPATPRASRSTLSDSGSRQTHTFHAVLDYDYDDGADGGVLDAGSQQQLQQHGQQRGPILVKNGSVPVVPLYSYPAFDNGTLVQIPILWTALSLALGLEIRGEVIRGVPCIKRFHQLFCPTAGNSYPIDRIELFIDENKALMKRMYGEFQMNEEYGPPAQEVFETQSSNRNTPLKRRSMEKREAPSRSTHHDTRGQPISEGGNVGSGESESPVSNARFPRQSSFRGNQSRETGRVDACESKVEIVTPYWASNSAGKIRAIVNTQHFEQAIHQEVCSKVQTIRCSGDCGCEQKYKWHRLLAYDPDNDCKGIFMDWFLFPSCCVCRCSPIDGH